MKAEKRPVLEYLVRFVAGGLAVSIFAALGDTLRPKGFAGLFGAAPSIALVTLVMAAEKKGTSFVASEARSMMAGAAALAAYSWAVCLLLKRAEYSVAGAALLALPLWFANAFALAAFFGLKP